MICQDVLDVVREGRKPLLLTERTEHLAQLAGMLATRVSHIVIRSKEAWARRNCAAR